VDIKHRSGSLSYVIINLQEQIPLLFIRKLLRLLSSSSFSSSLLNLNH